MAKLPSSPYISIVIPVRNEEANLPRVLDSIKNLDYPKQKTELIIVDGYSTDDTVKIAKNYGARVYYNSKKIRGAGCQVTLDKAKGEFIASTDADCVVPRHWLRGLLKHFTNERIAAVGGPNLTPRDDTPFAKAAGEAIWLLTRVGARYGFSTNKTVEVYHNPGCNVLYRKKAIRDVGGYNPYLLTCEDEELDFRLRKKGYKLLFTPNVSVDHYRRPTYKRIFIQSYRFAVGRIQAIKMFWRMARWFHFGPSLLLLSLLTAFCLIFFFPQFRILAFFYILTVLLSFFLASWYLVLTKKAAPFYVYFGVLSIWIFGWSLGFLRGILRR